MASFYAYYNERFGTHLSDVLGAADMDALYAGPGNDQITLSAWSHAYLMGGPGNDTYILGTGSQGVILDTSGYDTLQVPFSIDSTVVATIDGGRHVVFLDAYAGTSAVIINQPSHSIERISFVGTEFSVDAMQAAARSNGLHVGDLSISMIGQIAGIDAGGFSYGVEQEIGTLLAREDALFSFNTGQPVPQPEPGPAPSPEPAPAPAPEPTPAPVPTPVPETPEQAIGSYFDVEWYLSQYPDVAAAGVDPFWHYTHFGWKEGRDPNPYFDSDWYLAQNPDVAAAEMNPAEHYWMWGWKESRDPSAEFSTTSYFAVNPDVQLAGVNPLEHYIQWGLDEGRALA